MICLNKEMIKFTNTSLRLFSIFKESSSFSTERQKNFERFEKKIIFENIDFDALKMCLLYARIYYERNKHFITEEELTKLQKRLDLLENLDKKLALTMNFQENGSVLIETTFSRDRTTIGKMEPTDISGNVLTKDLRYELMNSYYIDIKISNAHLSFLYGILRQEKVEEEFPTLRSFYQNRDELFTRIGGDISLLKKLFLQTINGHEAPRVLDNLLLNDTLKSLFKEIKAIRRLLWDSPPLIFENKNLIKDSLLKKNSLTVPNENCYISFMELLLQNTERCYIEQTISFLEEKTPSYKNLIVPMNSGFLVPKKLNKSLLLKISDLKKELNICSNRFEKLNKMKLNFKVSSIKEQEENNSLYNT